MRHLAHFPSLKPGTTQEEYYKSTKVYTHYLGVHRNHAAPDSFTKEKAIGWRPALM
jgi:hypothetical protein